MYSHAACAELRMIRKCGTPYLHALLFSNLVTYCFLHVQLDLEPCAKFSRLSGCLRARVCYDAWYFGFLLVVIKRTSLRVLQVKDLSVLPRGKTSIPISLREFTALLLHLQEQS